MNVVTLSPNGVDIQAVHGRPELLLLATQDGIVRLHSPSWTSDGQSLKGQHVSSLMYADRTCFAGIHNGGLHRSDDDGLTWTPSDAGIEDRHVFSLASAHGTLFAGTEPANLYRSADQGRSWQIVPAIAVLPQRTKWNFPPPPHLAHVKHVAADPRNPNVLYVCVEQGALLKTTDGGASFEELAFEDEQCRFNKDTHRIVFDPSDADHLYLDGGDGIFESRDGGLGWTRLASTDMRISYPDHLYVAPDDPQTIFVAGAGTSPDIWRQTGNAASTMVVSRDGGGTWNEIGGGLPASLPGNIEAVSLVTWPGGYGFFAGTTDGEVFHSDDQGRTWSCIATGLPPVSKCVHARNLASGRSATGGM